MKNTLIIRIFAISTLLALTPANAWKIKVTNKTERILETQGEMVAAIAERKHTDWKRLKPGETVTFNTGARGPKGLKVRLPIGDDANKYMYPQITKTLLEESERVEMAINPHYVITYAITPDQDGSTETFFLMRMPKVLLSRPGGIVSTSKPVTFKTGINIPGILSNQQAFKRWEGSDDMAYDGAHYLMAHNAHSSLKYGYKIDPQQDLTITDLLKYGIRGFNMDTYLDGKEIVLMHGGKTWNPVLKLGGKPDKFKDRLAEIIEFMKDNPKVVVTLFFEDYVKKEAAKFDEIIKQYEQFIFTPQDYQEKKFQWPTLGWMRSTNKRLVIFKDTRDESKYIFGNEWNYHIENMFSETEIKGVTKERGSSHSRYQIPRNLYVFNFFGKVNALDYETTRKGYKTTLKDAVNHAIKYGLDGRYVGKIPTFLMVDFAEWGDGLDMVHDWNQPRPESTQPVQMPSQPVVQPGAQTED